ncbi:MAG: hypothetical protein K2Q10_09460 [Rhodospirillales bacterium]|nr:hypothetical protein [Rhodospirillales bacterium]
MAEHSAPLSPATIAALLRAQERWLSLLPETMAREDVVSLLQAVACSILSAPVLYSLAARTKEAED